MNRILEYSPAPEETIVSRILVMVHKAVDEHFPEAQKANRQFTKTVFSSEDYESTALNKAPASPEDPPGDQFADDTPTATFEANEETGEVPAADDQPSESEEPRQHNSALNPMKDMAESEPASRIGTLEDGEKEGPDYISAVLVAAIIVGLVVLATIMYVG